MILAAAQHAQQNQTLGTFIFSVASGLMVLLLGYLARTIRKFMREHYWLLEQVKDQGAVLKTQGEAITTLLEEHRPAKVPERSRPRRGRS